MKKPMMLALTLAMVLGAAVPAFGLDDTVTTRQGNTVVPSQVTGQDVESGDIGVVSDNDISGDNSGVCLPSQQFSTSGNDLTSFGLQPTQADLIDPELTGFETEDGNLVQDVQCVPTLTQEATATG